MKWTDRPGSSRRDDGAKVAEFVINGKVECWGYPSNWRPRCELQALGPFDNLQQAKYAVDTSLNLEMPESA